MFSFQKLKDGLRDIGVGMVVAGFLGLVFKDTSAVASAMAVSMGLVFFTVGVLKDDEEVLAVLEDEGIDRERVTSVDSTKVDEALEVTELSESAVYEIDEREYVLKAEVDEDVKESRLQGLKDRLAVSEEEETNDLRREIEELEDRIDDLTSFSTGSQLQS